MSKSNKGMHKRLNAAQDAKELVKHMILEKCTVKEILLEIKRNNIPVTAYKTLVEQGYIAKWRKM